MNKQRRLQLTSLQHRIDEIKEDIENIMMEEQEYFDNMPESLQGSEKGTKSEEAISAMENAIDELDSVMSHLEEASQ